MKTKSSQLNVNQAASSLWTPLSECQQELLSGGAPKVNGGGSGDGNGNGGSGSGSSAISTLLSLLS
ncbi:MAG: hypothetical protein ACAF41_16955 [Leptolyngbya sp. BL-A-14]